MTDIDRSELIAGLRELADFLEAHPDAPLPFPRLTMRTWNRDTFYEAVRAFAPMQETEGVFASDVALDRQFGALTIRAEAPRSTVCEKVERTETVEAWELPNDLRELLLREQLA